MRENNCPLCGCKIFSGDSDSMIWCEPCEKMVWAEPGLRAGPELRAAAQSLLRAAMDYHTVYRRSGGRAAVVWVEDTAGRLVILSRGDYRERLMENITKIPGENAVAFDAPVRVTRGKGG